MNALRTLFLFACCATIVSSFKYPRDPFRKQIQCLVPDSSQIGPYTNYGCYCGWGSSGTPVDERDRCCQVHDKCHDEATQVRLCWGIFDNPDTEWYAWSCDEASKTATCDENNRECRMFICECDRKFAECFARSPFNLDHYNLPSERCQ